MPAALPLLAVLALALAAFWAMRRAAHERPAPMKEKQPPPDCGERPRCSWGCDCPNSTGAAPDATGDPGTDDDGAPGYMMPPLPFGRRAECPKCKAKNEQRKANGLAPLPGYTFRLRARDGSLYCRRCDEYFIRCSEDSIIRPKPPDEAA